MNIIEEQSYESHRRSVQGRWKQWLAACSDRDNGAGDSFCESTAKSVMVQLGVRGIVPMLTRTM
eukprot:5324046-Karenia_brevis.AAC.1